MKAEELKSILHDDPSLIIRILEDCGIHHIKHIKERIQGCRPDGDNPTSVQVILKNSDLITVIHTDSNYKGGDIFSLIDYYKSIEFPQSINYVCNLIGIENTSEYKPKKKIFKVLDLMFKKKFDTIDEENIKLQDKILDEFIMLPHKKLSEQGVSIDTQLKFQTGYDIIDNRLLTPIRDEDGDLVTIKGRTLNKDFKQEGIPKFISYYNYIARKILYGLYENKLNIFYKNEAIVVESEKSVQQADSIGVNNVVAISKKKLSTEQITKLLELQCTLVLAFDKDVTPDAIILEASNFEKYVNVEIIYDFNDLLNEHDSPFDNGSGVWWQLYNDRLKLEDFRRWWTDECKRNGIS